MVEHAYELAARTDKNPAAGIFGLKNMGWTDTQRMEVSGMVAKFDMTYLSDDELMRVANGEPLAHVLAHLSGQRPALPAGTEAPAVPPGSHQP